MSEEINQKNLLKKKYCFVFCHGFGFDETYWKPFQNFFLEENFFIFSWNLGYFNEKKQDFQPIEQDVQYIGIGHSLGFRKLLESPIPWTYLIGLNGFFHFLGEKENLKQKRRQELLTLKKNFQKNPKKTMELFYQRTGVQQIPQGFLSDSIHIERLLSDLVLLEQPVNKPLYPYHLILSQNDMIVPLDLFHTSDHQNSLSIYGEKHCLGSLNDWALFKFIKKIIH